ncbi:MAG: hypothetical protein F4Y04_03875 [Chloroflexi bacterium]|nr:hypothetical protein [Chloroflexota bacterium]
MTTQTPTVNAGCEMTITRIMLGQGFARESIESTIELARSGDMSAVLALVEGAYHEHRGDERERRLMYS